MTSNQWWRPFTYAVIGIALGALLVLFVYQQIALNQATNRIDTVTSQIRETQKGSRSLIELITDCTDPGGECNQRQRANTAEAIGSINASQIAAIYCYGQQPDATYRELLTCVGDILDGRKTAR